jgi:Protein of unknown function (DUF2946)
MRALLPTLRPTAALRRLGVRLAFVAVLAAALMPTFSRLLQPVALADWATICQAATATSGADRSAPQDTAHEHGDACAFCSLAHTAPALGGAALPPVAVLAYAPPVPHAVMPVREGVPQARAPGARAPPSLA